MIVSFKNIGAYILLDMDIGARWDPNKPLGPTNGYCYDSIIELVVNRFISKEFAIFLVGLIMKNRISYITWNRILWGIEHSKLPKWIENL